MAEKGTEKAPGAFSLLGTASTMGLHMVSGPIVGGGLGWLVDHWLDSWPIASATGLLLGLIAGFRNVWADARYLERSNAVLDAEKKKREEEALNAEKKAEKVRKSEKKASEEPLVPLVRKAEKEEGRPQGNSPEKAGETVDDPFTASVMAGTASFQERELEELDETVEAIRRVLEGKGPSDFEKKAVEDGEKGQA